MPADRIAGQIRWPIPVKKSVNEYGLLTHQTEQAAVIDLILAGLRAGYGELGIEKDPAATASELLRVLGGIWEDELSQAELTAFGRTREALDRIAEIRSRDPR
jgi:hypothetical protein